MNLQPIHLPSGRDLSAVALDGFPVIDDFAVRVTEDDARNIEYTSATHGRLTGFPAWEAADRDLRHFTPSDVPIGALDEPYDDRDEGWRILVFEHAGWVYVLEAHDANATDFTTYFRVRRERYLQAWAALIDFFNPITPLDDTSEDDE